MFKKERRPIMVNAREEKQKIKEEEIIQSMTEKEKIKAMYRE